MDEHTAIARGSNLGISLKFAVEVARCIRGKNVGVAKDFLQQVIEQKKAVPFHRYDFDLGHKRGGVGPGRYPTKTALALLQVLKSAEANAEEKGLDIQSLYISRALVNKGNTLRKPGRHRGRLAKRTHVLFTLTERPAPKKEKKS